MSGESVKSMLLELLHGVWEDERALMAQGNEAQRVATPEQERLSTQDVQDVVAHIASWRHRHAEKLDAAVRGAPLPRWTETELIERLNAEAYAEWHQRSWQEVLDFARRSYAMLVERVEGLSEAQLSDPNWFPATRGESLWPEILGNGVWHPYTHLVECAHVRGDTALLAHLRNARLRGQELLLRALERTGASQQLRTEAAYDLACLCALTDQLERAVAVLQETVAQRPDLALYAKHDADLSALQADPTFQALTGVAEVHLITAQALHQALGGAGAAVVVDVRDPEEYVAGHVPGALNIPLDQLALRMAELPTGRLVVAYCNMHHRGTSRGERAAILLQAGGLFAQTLDGGYPAWSAFGLQIDAGVGAAIEAARGTSRE